MGINGKQKGNSFEREIANEFTFRFRDEFRRVPMSGGFVGGNNRERNLNLRADACEVLSGDIIVPIFFPFSLECKNYGEKTGPQMYSILEGNERVLDKWLGQARGDAEFSKKQFLILFKITRKASYICIDYKKFIETLKENNTELPNSFIKYKDTIILDKNDFLDNYVIYYLPLDKRTIKRTSDIINNKKEVKPNEQSKETE